MPHEAQNTSQLVYFPRAAMSENPQTGSALKAAPGCRLLALYRRRCCARREQEGPVTLNTQARNNAKDDYSISSERHAPKSSANKMSLYMGGLCSSGAFILYDTHSNCEVLAIVRYIRQPQQHKPAGSIQHKIDAECLSAIRKVW